MVYEYQVVLKTTMSNARRGLPLTKSHIEKIFPKLTSAQISPDPAMDIYVHSVELTKLADLSLSTVFKGMLTFVQHYTFSSYPIVHL